MIKWNDKVEDRHMEGRTEFGKVFVRLNREGKATAMYTLFGSTKKYIPDEKWMEDLEGAQLKLEDIVYRTKNTRDWGESLRSKKLSKK
jgi:hypothetical protein